MDVGAIDGGALRDQILLLRVNPGIRPHQLHGYIRKRRGATACRVGGPADVL